MADEAIYGRKINNIARSPLPAEHTSVHELYNDVYRGSAGMRTEEVRGQEDGRFSPSTSGVSSSQEVEKNKRATKHKLVRADLRRSGELAAQLEGKIDVLNNVSNAPPQLFEAAAGMHSGELGGAAVRVREGRPVARAKNASRADLRNVANPMAAGGEAEQAIYGTVYGERTATTDAKNVASERYAFQIQSH